MLRGARFRTDTAARSRRAHASAKGARLLSAAASNVQTIALRAGRKEIDRWRYTDAVFGKRRRSLSIEAPCER
ncbi:hypothetical protein WI41_16545 [Burkholderia latens]|uniref:Uncharacterized protein n=1 Tax=Burkholderia latens TaxID=488446 RepID=A0AAP1CCG8_9BURK|nr:hypothetical protein WI41_16545 [Burkholderia latens]